MLVRPCVHIQRLNLLTHRWFDHFFQCVGFAPPAKPRTIEQSSSCVEAIDCMQRPSICLLHANTATQQILKVATIQTMTQYSLLAAALTAYICMRLSGEQAVGPRSYRVVFAAISLPLAMLAVVYFINHRYDGLALWNVRGVPGVHDFIWILNFVSFFFLYPSTFNLLEVSALSRACVSVHGCCRDLLNIWLKRHMETHVMLMHALRTVGRPCKSPGFVLQSICTFHSPTSTNVCALRSLAAALPFPMMPNAHVLARLLMSSCLHALHRWQR